MCSVNDAENEGVTLIPTFSKIKPSATCRKCKTSPSIVLLQKKDAFCKECFLKAMIHKFRSTIGKTKIMRASDKVMVAFSGSQASVALMHMLQAGLNAESHKRLHFSVVVCYVDESALFDDNHMYNKTETTENIKQALDGSGFECYYTSLSEHVSESPELSRTGVGDETRHRYREEQLTGLLDSVTSLTAKEDLVQRLRRKLLLNVATQLQCTKLFTAEVGSGLAVSLLTNVCLGRGDQLSLETSFCEARHPNLLVLRPLRDFSSKEVAYYNIFNGLKPVALPSLTTMTPSDSSIRKLTETFVTGLQDQFPSTVYTIFRTGDKLTSVGTSPEEGVRSCVLCKAVLRAEGAGLSAVKAVDFSRRTVSKKSGEVGASCCGGCGTGCSKSKSPLVTREEIARCLCYGCQLILKDMKSLEYLPEELLLTVREELDFTAMREEISEFLLT